MKKTTKPKIEIDLNRVEALASRGLTYEQIAKNLGISDTTIYRRKKELPELQDAIKRGQAKGIAEISNALYESAKKGNVTAQIFFLCNRAREDWRNVNKIDISNTDGTLKPEPVLSAKEFEEIAKKLLKEV